jgi:hypothetical protein
LGRLMSRVVFYDNLQAIPLPDEPELVEVERIYCVQFDRFSEDDWTRLDQIYRDLPGAYRENKIPFWYGDSEEAPVHLSASVEPPGIQVYGIIPLEQWKLWDAAFQKALAESTLPFRKLDSGKT